MKTGLSLALDPNRRSTEARDFDATLRRKIVGQDQAIEKVVEIYQMFLAGLNAPGRVRDHISGQHAAAHQKGADGLSAGASWDIRHLAAADGTRPSSPQPEADAARPAARAGHQ